MTLGSVLPSIAACSNGGGGAWQTSKEKQAFHYSFACSLVSYTFPSNASLSLASCFCFLFFFPLFLLVCVIKTAAKNSTYPCMTIEVCIRMLSKGFKVNIAKVVEGPLYTHSQFGTVCDACADWNRSRTWTWGNWEASWLAQESRTQYDLSQTINTDCCLLCRAQDSQASRRLRTRELSGLRSMWLRRTFSFLRAVFHTCAAVWKTARVKKDVAQRASQKSRCYIIAGWFPLSKSNNSNFVCGTVLFSNTAISNALGDFWVSTNGPWFHWRGSLNLQRMQNTISQKDLWKVGKFLNPFYFNPQDCFFSFFLF